MPVYKDARGRLFIEFQYKGHRHKERLPKDTSRADAEKLEVKIKNDLMFQSHGISQTLTFDDVLAQYFGPYAETHYSKDSYEKAIYICKSALPFFRGRPIRSIKKSDIEKFKTFRVNLETQHGTTRSPATVEREMSVISKVFSIAVQNDLCDYNPCSRVEKLKFDNVQDKILRREDEAKFFAALKTVWAKDVCLMALYGGLRQNDIMTMSRFDVKLNDDLINLVQGKTKRRVRIPLNDITRAVIVSRWHNGKDLLFPSPRTGDEHGSVRHSMQRACKKLEIPLLSIRDLRRTFATRLLEEGADAVTVAWLLGHGSLRMVPRYVRTFEMARDATQNMAKNSPQSATYPPTGQVSSLQVLKGKGLK